MPSLNPKTPNTSHAPIIKGAPRKVLTDIAFSSDAGLEAKRQIRVTAASGKSDRTGDIVMTAGINLKDYAKNPIVLWAHDHQGLPVAKAVEFGIVAGKLEMIFEFATKEIYEFADTVYKLVKGGFLKGVSIGARVKEAEWITDAATGDIIGRRFLALDLLEVSIVPIPADSKALITAVKSGAVSSEDMEECLAKSFDTPLDFSEGNPVSIDTSSDSLDEEETEVTKAELDNLNTRIAGLEDLVKSLTPGSEAVTLSARIGAIESLIQAGQKHATDSQSRIMESLDSVVKSLASGKAPDVDALTHALKGITPTADKDGDGAGKLMALITNMSTKLSAPR